MIPGYMDISNGMSEHPAEIVAQETYFWQELSNCVCGDKICHFKLNVYFIFCAWPNKVICTALSQHKAEHLT